MHTMDPDGITNRDVGHVLGRDEDVLLIWRGIRRVNLFDSREQPCRRCEGLGYTPSSSC